MYVYAVLKHDEGIHFDRYGEPVVTTSLISVHRKRDDARATVMKLLHNSLYDDIWFSVHELFVQ